MASNRKPPNLTEKLAAALLCIPQRDKAGRPKLDGMGCMVPLVTFAEARLMTATQIISLFQWDHSVYHAWEPSTHPTRLTPRFIQEHRTKSKRDKTVIARVKRQQRARQVSDGFEMRVLNGTAEINAVLDKLPKRTKDRRKAAPMPGSKASIYKRKLNGKTVRRDAHA